MTALSQEEPRENTGQEGHAVGREAVAQVRAFSRFFTNRIGVLRSGLLESPWPLTHARVLYEVAQADTVSVADLRQTLDMDAGQLSRVLSVFVADGLVHRRSAPEDGRRQIVGLTDAGHRAAQLLDTRSNEQVSEQLARLTPNDQHDLVAAMATVRRLFADPPTPRGSDAQAHQGTGPVTLRAPQPGDLGWVVERHGALYAAEYGWNQEFEALVAEVVADFARSATPEHDAAWIAELGGRRVGSILCTRVDDTTAKLRLLLVEPSARGHGVGQRLVEACTAFAREAGYHRITLWTNDCLTAARRIYESAGFVLLRSEPHHRFGVDIVGETWGRSL